MLMNVYAMMFIIRVTIAYDSEEYSPNVGTVLFSTDDMKKHEWTKTQISLLRARRYFQTVLPPANLVNDFNEDFGNVLLNYFKNAYSHIKREATDHETDSIMTTALSDALGGYLKIWVLPVAKLDYYGGTVSQEHILKLFQFYNEIKSYLNTDGFGWRNPNDKYLNYLTINVAPITNSNTRVMRNPCDQIAFFERTSNGIGIPLPNVNWDKKSSTMFVPLKNMSLISMTAPDSSNALVKYYNIAKQCLAEVNPTECEKFDEKFQSWLRSSVVPHLQDDLLYLPLGHVLALVNNTHDYKGLIKPLPQKPIQVTTKPVCVVDVTSSKKMTVIFVILLLEIAWCVPALIYILCAKRKKLLNSNIEMDTEQNEEENNTIEDKVNEKRSVCGPDCDVMNKELLGKRSILRKYSCLKLFQHKNTDAKPFEIKDAEAQSFVPIDDVSTNTSRDLICKVQTFQTEFETQYPSNQFIITAGTGSHSYLSSKNQSSDAMRLLEKNYTPKIPICNKPSEHLTRTVHTPQVLAVSGTVFDNKNYGRKSQLKKNPRDKEGKPTESQRRQVSDHNKSATKVLQKRNGQSRNTKPSQISKQNSQNKDLKQRNEKYSERSCEPTTVMPARTASNTTIESECKIMTSSQFSEKQKSCHRTDKSTPRSTPGLTSKSTTSKTVTPNENVSSETDDRLGKMKVNETKQSRSKKASIKVSDHGKPYFEITFEKPSTEINVNVTAALPMNTKYQKRSKIPKRNANIPQQPLISNVTDHSEEPATSTQDTKPKCLIPQPKKNVVDDIVLTEYCHKPYKDIYNSLNDTL